MRHSCIPHRATDSAFALAEELARRLRAETAGEVRFDAASRGRYATDASIYQVMPVGVFVPTSDRDVAVAYRDRARARRAGAGARRGHEPVRPDDRRRARHRRQQASAPDASRSTPSGARRRSSRALVLDHLNAQLKPLGLWFPVDVSTSAQATIGGMAGNNSCGSRSIEYGNMVHNVLGIRARMADGAEVDFGPVDGATGRAAQIAAFVRDLALRHRGEIEARWPKVLRRVGGYSLDIFHPQSEKPYTDDGSVNLAHLLVGAEGTLAWSRELTLKLAPLPGAKVLGVVNFPTFRAAMAAAQHIVTLGPTAVELVDRTMIDLALANPAFGATMRTALRGEPAAILLVEFLPATPRPGLVPRLQRLVELMGDLGLPGSVVEMADDAAQKNLWEVRKAGLNIMMSLKGDGKPVSFIEDCAVPLAHLADYTDALTEVFTRHGTRGTWYAHASVGTLHVRPILDMRRDGAAKMRAIAEEASQLVAKYKGAFSGEHGDGLCRGEWIAWQFGPALTEAFRAIKNELDPKRLLSPGRIVDPPRMDDVTLFRFPPPQAPAPYRTIALVPALDWSAWDVQNDPRTEQVTAPGSGGDSTGGFAKAVEMCNNNGHCRKFDAGTMCPSFRVTRDEQHLTARPRQHAAPGALGPARRGRADERGGVRGDGSVRVVQGLQARVPDRRRHGADEDRVPRPLQAAPRLHAEGPAGRAPARLRACGEPRAVARQPARPHSRRGGARRTAARPVGAAPPADLAPRHVLARPRPVAVRQRRGDDRRRAFRRQGRAPLRRHLQRRLRERERARRGARAARRRLHAAHARQGRRPSLLRPDLSRQRHGRPGAGQRLRRAGRCAAAVRRRRHRHRRPRAVVPADAARRSARARPRARRRATVAGQALLFEEFIAREAKAGRFAIDFTPLAQPILVHGHCHQKAFAAVAPILDVLRLVPGAKPELIETSCCGMAGSFGYEASHHDVSLQMAEASLLPAIRKAPEAIVVADGTSCRQQIDGGAGREALHVARLLERCLPGASR